MTTKRTKSLADFDVSPQKRARSKRTNGFMLLGLAAILALLAFLGLIYAVFEARKMTNGGQYPTVAGDIERVWISEYRGRRGSRSYDLNVRYNYAVGSRSFQQVSSLRYELSSLAEQAAADLEARGQTTVWYDPTDPNRSSIYRIGIEFLLLPGGGGLAALAACLTFAWIGMGMFDQAKLIERGETIANAKRPTRTPQKDDFSFE